MKYMGRAALLAFLIALVGATPAQAAPDPAGVYNRIVASANPAATYSWLTPAQQNAFRFYLLPAATSVRPIASPSRMRAQAPLALAASGCKNLGNVVSARNAFGVELWRYELYVNFCWNSGRITYSEAHDKGLVYVAFWSWRQISLTKSVATSLMPQRLTVAAQAEFKVCLFADIGCMQYYYPWHTMRALGDGTVTLWAMGK